MISMDELRQKSEEYLDGRIRYREFYDWVEPLADECFDIWRKEHPGSNNVEFPENSVEDMILHVELMDSEMKCSGSFRSEAMFREDLKSMLAGEPMTAFELDWDKYMEWCRSMEEWDKKHNGGAWKKFSDRVSELFAGRGPNV